jgi:hypothetical protein
LTIAPGDEVPTGNFAVVGVTVFACPTPGCAAAVQRQFTPEVHIDGKAAGTYPDLRIDLTGSRPGGETFNEAFGPDGSDLIPVSFQLYFNKSSGIPLTAYIDNVRFGTTPPAVPGDYNQNGVVDAADYAIWRKNLSTNFQLPNEVAGTTPGQVTAEDYDAWRARFSNTSGSGSALQVGSVPEPNCAVLVFLSAILFLPQMRSCRLPT